MAEPTTDEKVEAAIHTVGLLLFFTGRFRAKLSWHVLREVRIRTMWHMLKIGLPSGVGSISFSLGRMVVLPLIAHFGPAVVAVYGMGNRYIEFGEICVVGLELGMSPLVGHALGARDKALAWLTAKKAIWLGLGLMSVFGVVTYIFATDITSIFFREQEYLDLGTTFFRIAAIGFPFIGIFILLEGAFTGSGDTVPPMVIGVIHSWILQIPLIWFWAYALDYGPKGVWWGQVLAIALSVVGFSIWFKRGKWLEREV